MKMATTCCVPNCLKTRSDGVILHVFPNPETEPERFREWMYSIGGDLLALDNKKIFKCRRVCHTHFEHKYYMASKRLAVNSVPTLFLKGYPAPTPSTSKLESPTTLSTAWTATNKFLHTETDLEQPTLKGHPVPTPSTSKLESPTTLSTARTATNEFLHTETDLQQPSTSKDSKNRTRHLSKMFSSDASTLTRQIRKLQACKDKFAAKLKKALKLSENPTFQKATSKFTSAALIFTLLQFREIGKSQMGRRFTKDEKIMALSLYKRGPKAYRWLRYIFVLPSPMTLSRMISNANLRPGINENIFKHLKRRVNKMTETEKMCLLLFDEIALSPHFDYNKKRDEIVGFENNGKNKTKKIADHALVFMIRGIQKNYKQPICYTFCAGSTNKQELAKLIEDVIVKLKQAGLNVMATVCDQGASNVSAINYLVNKTKMDYIKRNKEMNHDIFEIGDQEIVPLFDPPHLIKGIRNNLLTKNLSCVIGSQHKVAKWDHIKDLFRENPAYQGIRLLPKITENHVDPKKMLKMKVKCATQIFSRSVAVNMGYLADHGILHEKCKETADVLLFFDNLFDSVNGSFHGAKKNTAKPLLGPLTPTSVHSKVWVDALQVLGTMKFVDNIGRTCVVPSIKNWQRTIENLMYLKSKLFDNNIKSIWLRHFNQDPLENFFGCIRSHGVRNVNPTCAGFEVAFAAIMINNLSSMHSPGSNCEKDNCYSFKSIKNLFFTTNQIHDCESIMNMDHFYNNDIIANFEDKVKNPKIKAQLEYVTGYILRKTHGGVKHCPACTSYLFDEHKESEYIRRKEHLPKKIKLLYPSNKLTEIFSNIQDVAIFILRGDAEIRNIKNYMKTLINFHCNFSFQCNYHRNDLLEKISDIACRFFINNWCRDTNKILKGKRSDTDEKDELQINAYMYYRKRIKFTKM